MCWHTQSPKLLDRLLSNFGSILEISCRRLNAIQNLDIHPHQEFDDVISMNYILNDLNVTRKYARYNNVILPTPDRSGAVAISRKQGDAVTTFLLCCD